MVLELFCVFFLDVMDFLLVFNQVKKMVDKDMKNTSATKICTPADSLPTSTHTPTVRYVSGKVPGDILRFETYNLDNWLQCLSAVQKVFQKQLKQQKRNKNLEVLDQTVNMIFTPTEMQLTVYNASQKRCVNWTLEKEFIGEGNYFVQPEGLYFGIKLKSLLKAIKSIYRGQKETCMVFETLPHSQIECSSMSETRSSKHCPRFQFRPRSENMIIKNRTNVNYLLVNLHQLPWIQICLTHRHISTTIVFYLKFLVKPFTKC